MGINMLLYVSEQELMAANQSINGDQMVASSRLNWHNTVSAILTVWCFFLLG